jgi:ribosomal-protein-alanine N-acetyltransferase
MDEYFDILRDEQVQKYLGGGVPLFDKEPHITNWLNNINGRLLKNKIVFTWCVEEKCTGKIAGRVDLGGFNKKTMAEISYHFGKNFWNRGVATEVIERVTSFGLENLKLLRIQGLVRKENIASMHVLEKNLYQKEGVLHCYPFGKEFHTVVMMAIVSPVFNEKEE